MLQQTQVERVTPLFLAFVENFSSFAALAQGSRADVIRLWKGLGYNSRAVRLHELARRVTETYGGTLPQNVEQLRALPGVGPYTLAAILAFAFNEPTIAFDTNIRRVVHRLFWGLEHPYQASLATIEARASDMLPQVNARDWNAAMMDLGSSLCTARAPKCLLCPLQADCAAAPIDAYKLADRAKAARRPGGPQSRIRFEETKRYARGRIVDCLRALAPAARISLLDLHYELRTHLAGRAQDEVAQILAELRRDGLVDHDEGGFCLQQ